MLERLQHPSIIRIRDAGFDKTRPYLVMDYAPQGSLRERYPEGTVLSLETINLYIQQIADALEYAHSEHIVHCDIKPDNILLAQDGRLLLSDFGIAQVVHTTLPNTTRGPAGTPEYMAPEQFLGKPKPASDQYALGIMVYEWLCGTPPFRGEFLRLMDQHQRTFVPSLRSRNTDISEEVEQIVLRTLMKDPHERYPSEKAFAQAFGQAIVPLTLSLSPTPLTLTNRQSQMGLTQNQSLSLSRQDVAPPSPQKRRLGRRFSLLVGGALGLICLLIVLNITFRPILFVIGGRPSVTPTMRQNVPLATSTHPNQIVQKWTFSTGDRVYSSPTVVNGVVYVGSYDFNVYAIDASTGQKKWAFPTGNWVYSSPTVVNGVVYVGSYDFNVYAIDASTGQKKWAFPTGGYVQFSPKVVNGVVYVGSGDLSVYAIDASTGQKKWVFPTGGSVYSSPMVIDGVVYVGFYDFNVYAIDASTGQKKWAFPTHNFVESSPMVVNGVLYIGSTDHNVYAIDASTGQKKWAFPTGDWVHSSPTVVDGVLYVGSNDFKVYAIDASTGQKKWVFPTGNYVWSSPTMVNGVVYVGSYDKKVYAIDASTGQKKWAFPTGNWVHSSPIVVDGVLYIGSDDDNVYALALPV